MGISKKGKFLIVVVTLCISLLALDQSQAAVEKYTEGVIKDGIAFVSARFVSKTFGADLRWAGDVRSLLLTYKQKIVHLSIETDISDFNMLPKIKPTINLPAIVADGEVYVPLIEICETLDATIDFDAANKNAVVIRDDIKMIVDLSCERTISPRGKGNRKEQIALPVYQFIPSSDPEGYDTNLDSTTKQITIPVNLKKTALVVIDFWGDRITNDAFYDNTASLIYLARKHGIPIIHAPNEGLSLPQYRVNPRILPIPDNEPVLPITETVESYFAKNNMDIDTLLYAGYGTCWCLIYSKVNSINHLIRRTNKFRIIVIKDATNAPYWCYSFAINGIETKFMSSTLNNLSKALGDEIRAVEAVPSGYYLDSPTYRIDDNFGLDVDFSKTSLMLINVWDYHENRGWLKRIKYNTSKNILPLVQFARSRGMKIIHIPNGRKVDPALKLGKDEPELKSIDEIRRYISDNGISTIIYAGNLINTTDLFPPIDVWGFTLSSSLPAVSRILEDCLILFETKESLANQQFKKVFLGLATSYTGAQHEVTTFSVLQRNTRFRLIQPNERFHLSDTNRLEHSLLRVIANFPEKEKSGEIVIGDRENTLLIPSRSLKGTANLVFSNWGKARADFYILGANKLLAESENNDKWKPGYQNILYSDNVNENLFFRFETVYPIQKTEIRLNVRNYADRNDVVARMSFSYNGGETYRDLEEKRTTCDDGNFIWYLKDIPAESQTLMVKIGLQSMNDHIGIESLRLNLDLRTNKVIDFDENSLYIENRTNIPIKFDIVNAIKLKKVPF